MKRLISTWLLLILAFAPLAWSHDDHAHHRYDKYSDDQRYDKDHKYSHHKKHRKHYRKHKQHYRKHYYNSHRRPHYWNGYGHNNWSVRYYSIKPYGFNSYNYGYNKRHGHYHGLTLCYSSH